MISVNGKKHSFECTPSPVQRYPWHLLESPGDELTFTGKFISIPSIRLSFSYLAKRRGWKFKTHKESRPVRVTCTRLS